MQSITLILMFLLSKEHTRGLGIYTLCDFFFLYVYIMSLFKDKMFLVADLENSYDHGKFFLCVNVLHSERNKAKKRIETNW